jgi:hypothetical protein
MAIKGQLPLHHFLPAARLPLHPIKIKPRPSCSPASLLLSCPACCCLALIRTTLPQQSSQLSSSIALAVSGYLVVPHRRTKTRRRRHLRLRATKPSCIYSACPHCQTPRTGPAASVQRSRPASAMTRRHPLQLPGRLCYLLLLFLYQDNAGAPSSTPPRGCSPSVCRHHTRYTELHQYV